MNKILFFLISFSVSLSGMKKNDSAGDKGKVPTHDLLINVASKDMPTGVQELIIANLTLDINAAHNNTTALHAAAKALRVKVVKELLKAKADPNVQDPEGNTPLIALIKGVEYIEEVREGFCFAPSIYTIPTDSAYTALKIADELLEVGAGANIKNHSQESPLLIAIQKGWMRMVEILLDYGANPNEGRTDEGKTALMMANHKATARLLKNGAEINDTDNNGQTALFYACSTDSGSTAKMKILLKAGANVHIRNKNNETVLQFAMQHGKEKRLKLLKKYGATL